MTRDLFFCLLLLALWSSPGDLLAQCYTLNDGETGCAEAMGGSFSDEYTCSGCVEMVCQNREFREVVMPSAWAWHNEYPDGFTDSDEGGAEYVEVTFDCGSDGECDEECVEVNTGEVTYTTCVVISGATYDFDWYYLQGDCSYDPEEGQ